MKLKSVLLGSVALLSASALSAQAGDFYVSAVGGLDLSSDKFDNFGGFFGSTTGFAGNAKAHEGYFVGVALGYDLSKMFIGGLRGEVEVAKRQNNLHGGGTSFYFGIKPIDEDFQQENWSVMANVWYDIDTGTRWKPYLGGGIGWARDKVHGRVVGATASSFNITAHNEASGFAYQLGAGLDVAIRPGVDIGVGYRYFSGPDVGSWTQPGFVAQGVNDIHNDIEFHVRFGIGS